VVQRFVRSGELIGRQDAQDIVGTVMLRLVQRLHAAEAGAEPPIESVPDYVAALTFNAVNDHFRTRNPERARLRNRLRYALSHDRRLALWTIAEHLAGGLSAWRGAQTARREAWPMPESLAARADADRPAEALVALFQAAGEPFLLRALLDTLAPLWLRQLPQIRLAAPIDRPTPLDTVQWRSLLAALWSEIAQLRPLQRKALLLNLRDVESEHALDLFVAVGTASMEEIARALEMPPDQLAAVWNELPLDDLRIADMLALTRQQVINLRKSARERLTRRLRGLR